MSGANRPDWNATVVVILKDEAPYIHDWLVYYLSLGFEHIFVYDNGSTDGITSALRKFIAGGVVTYIYWPVRGGQIDAYNHATKLLRGVSEWVGFFDVDEYVVLHEHETITAFLAEADADQILLPWKNFPYGGHKIAPGGNDIENYFWSYRSEISSVVQVKHLVRCAVVQHTTAHCSVISSDRTVLADGSSSRVTHIITGPSYKKAQINHYFTRSHVENVVRLQKGQVDGGAEKQIAEFQPLSAASMPGLEYDNSILRRFGQFSLTRSYWNSVSDSPHRFGLMQSRPILLSWNNIPFYFCKSYANYLEAKDRITHGTDLKLIYVDTSGREVELKRFWHGADLTSVHFRVDDRSFLPFFLGTIHYGDFARRFGFEPLMIETDFEITDRWSASQGYSGACFCGIFEVESLNGVAITVTRIEQVVVTYSVPAGRHAVMVYSPQYLPPGSDATISIVGPCSIRELIIGSLP